MLPLFKLHLYITNTLNDKHNTYFDRNYKEVHVIRIKWINTNYVGFLVNGCNRYPINLPYRYESYTKELYAHNNVFALEYKLKIYKKQITLDINIFEYTKKQKEYLEECFCFTAPYNKTQICNISYGQLNDQIKRFGINYYNQWFTKLYKV